ncbi:alpha-glucosidase [Bdellovibrio sp. qaytius]|nr:alpha-glucosidase [Bdellovibrio sp. qaytius]
MKVLIFSGSLRKESLNKKLCHVVTDIFHKNNLAEVHYVDLQPLNIPVYDGDFETSQGIPAGIMNLGKQITAADAIVVCTPEYNGSIPGSLKNVIDWLSREKPVPLTGKQLLLLAASPGALGGTRSLWHTRQPFEVLNTHVYPEMMGVPKAHEAILPTNTLADAKMQANLERLVKDFANHAKKFMQSSAAQEAHDTAPVQARPTSTGGTTASTTH